LPFTAEGIGLSTFWLFAFFANYANRMEFYKFYALYEILEPVNCIKSAPPPLPVNYYYRIYC